MIFLENLALYNTKGEVPDPGTTHASANGQPPEEYAVPLGPAPLIQQGTAPTPLS